LVRRQISFLMYHRRQIHDFQSQMIQAILNDNFKS